LKFEETLEDANHLQSSPVQAHIKVETMQKTDKIIHDAFGISFDVY
jgi:hypothetical protein